MSCCGSRRARARRVANRAALGASRAQLPPGAPRHPGAATKGARGNGVGATPAGAVMLLRYVGESNLIVEGPVTRRRYLFERPGAVVTVEVRDGAALQGVPILEPA